MTPSELIAALANPPQTDEDARKLNEAFALAIAERRVGDCETLDELYVGKFHVARQENCGEERRIYWSSPLPNFIGSVDAALAGMPEGMELLSSLGNSVIIGIPPLRPNSVKFSGESNGTDTPAMARAICSAIVAIGKPGVSS